MINLIKKYQSLFLFAVLMVTACREPSKNSLPSPQSAKANSFNQNPPQHEMAKQVTLILPSGEKLKTILALTEAEQTKGLSGTKAHEFQDDMAMLFFYTYDSEKRFWMPDTYFDLDIYFLDKDLVVIDVDRDVPHHPGRDYNPPIAQTRTIYSRHVLEIASRSPLAKKLKPGMKLSWQGEMTPWQIESRIRQEQSRPAAL